MAETLTVKSLRGGVVGWVGSSPLLGHSHSQVWLWQQLNIFLFQWAILRRGEIFGMCVYLFKLRERIVTFMWRPLHFIILWKGIFHISFEKAKWFREDCISKKKEITNIVYSEKKLALNWWSQHLEKSQPLEQPEYEQSQKLVYYIIILMHSTEMKPHYANLHHKSLFSLCWKKIENVLVATAGMHLRFAFCCQL